MSKKTVYKVTNHTDYFFFSQFDNEVLKRFCTKYIDRNLPEEFKQHRGIRKFIIDLMIQTPIYDKDLNSIDKEYQRVEVSAVAFENHYGAIYYKKFNQPRKNPKNKPIDPESGKAVIDLLLDKEVVKRSSYSKINGRCREYKLSDKFLDDHEAMHQVKLKYLENFKKMINNKIDDIKDKSIDAGDMIFQLKGNLLFEKDNIELANDKLMTLTDTMKELTNSGIISCNYVAVDMIIRLIDGQINKLNKWMLKINPDFHKTLKLPADENVKMYSGVTQKLRTMITNTSLTMNQKNILFHKANLKIATTGRITACDGLGVLGLSRDLKADNYLLIESIIKENIYNYDLRASQVAAIITYGKRVGLEFKYLEKYVSDSEWKKEISKKINVPLRLVKTCIISLMFGSSGKLRYNKIKLSEKKSEKLSYKPEDSAFVENCKKYGIYKKEEQVNFLLKFNKECKGIIEDIQLYFNNIELIIKTLKSKKENNKDWYSNGCIWGNEKLFEKDYIKGDTDKTKNYKYNKFASSFLLQGLESYFIYTLINLAKDYDYKVLSYEYDGIICIGEIPEEAINIAIDITGFEDAILEVKDIN